MVRICVDFIGEVRIRVVKFVWIDFDDGFYRMDVILVLSCFGG